MALPKCPKCDWTGFQSTTISPAQSTVKIIAIHCAKCGCVVGTEPYYVTSHLLEKIAKKMGFNLLT